MQDMDVLGVKVELPLHAPVLLLREAGEGRYLPIWIGATEATAIADGLDHTRGDRPMTHDLMLALLEGSGVTLESVEIVSVDTASGVFLAELVLSNGARVDSRPSDAVALAVRAGAAVRCHDAVLAEAGVSLDGGPGARDREIRRFRSFLEGVTADDFGV